MFAWHDAAHTSTTDVVGPLHVRNRVSSLDIIRGFSGRRAGSPRGRGQECTARNRSIELSLREWNQCLFRGHVRRSIVLEFSPQGLERLEPAQQRTQLDA